MSANTEFRDIWIVGAGLAGALLGSLLSKRGFKVCISEKRSSVELEQLAAGRSINLALAERGRYALECAGLIDEGAEASQQQSVEAAVLAQAIAMPGRHVHMPDGSENFQPYSASGKQAIWSVHRARLNRTLLHAARNAGASIHFGERLQRVDLENNFAELERDGGLQRVNFGLVIGADGAGSMVREAIAASRPETPAAHVDFLDHAYKEIHIPPAPTGGFALSPHALHIWPRERFMLIALPNPDHSFTATLFLQNQGELSFATLEAGSTEQQREQIAQFFTRYFADVVALVPDLVEQMLHHPKGMLGTLHCQTWDYSHRAVLVGDAAHAIVPFHGQGMNCAFEDCIELAERLRPEQSEAERAEALNSYSNSRWPQARAIAEMALENYVEMRDHVADDDFRLRKALEQALARALPGHFVPRYELVSFTRFDYARAQERGLWQSALLHEFCAGKTSLSQIDLAAAVSRVRAELPDLAIQLS